MLFSPLLEGGTTHQAVMVIRLTVLTLGGLYLLQGLGRGRLPIPRFTLALPTMTYLGLAALSAALSPYTHQSVQWLMVLLTYAVLLYLIVFFLRRWDHAATLLVIVTAVGVLEATVALRQGWAGSIRPHGTFFNPNFLAGYLVAVGTVVLSAACYRRTLPRWSHRLVTLAMWAVLGVIVTAILWTGSRGGILAFLTGTGVVLWLRFRWKGLGALIVLCVALTLLANPLRDRVLTEHFHNPLGYGRLQIWQSSVQAMLQQPTGFGLGLYQYVYPQYAAPIEGEIARYGKAAQTAHNEYLQMGVELGVVGLGIFLWGILALSRVARRALTLRLRRSHRAMLEGTSAGVLAILVHAAVDSNLHEPAIAIVLTLYAGILLSASQLKAPSAAPDRSIPIGPPWVAATAAIFLIAFCMVAVLRLGAGWMAYESGSGADNLDEAVVRYETAIDLDPGKSLYHSAVAAVRFKQFEATHDPAAAMAAAAELKRAMELNPLDGRLPGLLGHLYLVLSETPSATTASSWTVTLEAARSAYERAATLEPFMPAHRLALGQIAWALGDSLVAERRVREAIEIEPNYLPAREWLVKRYSASGRPTEALHEYEEIVRRQALYANRPKDKLEERYLAVDAQSLRSVLQAPERRT